MTAVLRCPHCKKEVSRDNPFLPFCSERCRLVDLDRWFEGEYRVAGEKTQEEETPVAQDHERDAEPD